VTNNLNVMWSDDPEDWRPINHACDPNTWLDGLDLVARRDIRPGEELTVDYATFCGPTMSAFACHCGSSDCRRVILGTDHLLPLIRSDMGITFRTSFADLAEYRPDWQPPFEIVQNSYGLGLVARRAWRAWAVVTPLRFGRQMTRDSLGAAGTRCKISQSCVHAAPPMAFWVGNHCRAFPESPPFLETHCFLEAQKIPHVACSQESIGQRLLTDIGTDD
jgi:hypothetical protein